VTTDSGKWTWEGATLRERADWVRAHRSFSKPLSRNQIRDLFRLTDEGVDAIFAGADWRPEHQRKSEVQP
jgi:hypothetical protein